MPPGEEAQVDQASERPSLGLEVTADGEGRLRVTRMAPSGLASRSRMIREGDVLVAMSSGTGPARPITGATPPSLEGEGPWVLDLIREGEPDVVCVRLGGPPATASGGGPRGQGVAPWGAGDGGVAGALRRQVLSVAAGAVGQPPRRRIEHRWTLWEGPDDADADAEAGEAGRWAEDDATTSLLPPNYAGGDWGAPRGGVGVSSRAWTVAGGLAFFVAVCALVAVLEGHIPWLAR